jgi:hypothetical protein
MSVVLAAFRTITFTVEKHGHAGLQRTSHKWQSSYYGILSCIWHVAAVKDSSFSTVLLHGKKLKLIKRGDTHTHTHTHIHTYIYIRHLLQQINSQQLPSVGKEYHGNCPLGPQTCASWVHCNCWVLLWRTWEITGDQSMQNTRFLRPDVILNNTNPRTGA